jgi:peptidoglycan/LPS O-acetylase OafA/YrhL
MWIVFLIFLTLLCSLLVGEATFRFGWIVVPDASRRIGCIDGLRGYLALLVFVHHSLHWQYGLKDRHWGPQQGNVLANMGAASVALFFMITAILFYPKVVRRLSDTEWLAHFVSRIFRLTPLMWVATAGAVCVALMQNGFHLGGEPAVITLSVIQWLSFYGTPDLFGQPFTYRIIAGVTWSLVYEWGFYVVLPACSYFYNFIKNRIRPLVLLVALFFFFERLIIQGYLGPLYYVMFVTGMIVAELIRIPKVAGILRSPWAAVIGLAALFCEFTFYHTAFAFAPTVLLAIFLAPVAAGNSYFKVLSLNGSVVLGEISYGIYLLHGIVLYVVTHALRWSNYYLLPVLASLVIVTAILAHRLVEAPAIALGKRLAMQLQRADFQFPWTTSVPSIVPEPSPPRRF